MANKGGAVGSAGGRLDWDKADNDFAPGAPVLNVTLKKDAASSSASAATTPVAATTPGGAATGPTLPPSPAPSGFGVASEAGGSGSGGSGGGRDLSDNDVDGNNGSSSGADVSPKKATAVMGLAREAWEAATAAAAAAKGEKAGVNGDLVDGDEAGPAAAEVREAAVFRLVV